MTTLRLACPLCHEPFQVVDDVRRYCEGDDLAFHSEDGIWRMLLPARESEQASLIGAYQAHHLPQSHGSDDPRYFRYLPFHDLSGQYQSDWHDRGERYLHFLIDVLQPYELQNGGFLNILDIGAGSGWMSARLSCRGHSVAAVDLSTSAYDGLGAYPAYGDEFLPIQAEFDYLPFEDGIFDVVIFNDSLPYSPDRETTLREGLRVIRHGGLLAILDTPLYRHAPSHDQVPVGPVLTFDHLQSLESMLSLTWSFSWPDPAWRRLLDQIKIRLRGQQPPLQIPVIYTRKR